MSKSNDEKRSDTPHRGFRFFFWVSATLFFLAGANWLFNLYIGISGSISYLLGVAVLIFEIFLVAGLLNAAYTFVPNIRVILDGVLGLDKAQGVQETSTPEESPTNLQKRGKNPEFDKDIELAKVSFVAEEWRAWALMKIGTLLTAFVGISAVLLAAEYAKQLSWIVTVSGILFVGVFSFVIAKYWFVKPYERRTQRLGFLLNEIGNGHSIGELSDLLKEKY